MKNLISPHISRPYSKCLVNTSDTLFRLHLQRDRSHLSKAIFLDRDGILNVEKGYITKPTEIELYPDIGPVLKRFSLLGLIIIISNQSAIGRGLITVDQFEQINQAIWIKLRKSKSFYNALYYCPHIPENKCDCRKPKPGLILQASLDFDIDLSESYMIGDKLSDIEAGKRAGCTTILVLTGRGAEAAEIIEKDVTVVKPDVVLAGLSDALVWIENKRNGSE